MSEPTEPQPLTEEPAGGLGTLTEERAVPVETDEGDHERFSHYVKKDRIVESAVLGVPVVALCGKVWVPNRDPQRFPICPDCRDIYNSLPPGGGDAD
jgi:hypothetical protein